MEIETSGFMNYSVAMLAIVVTTILFSVKQ